MVLWVKSYSLSLRSSDFSHLSVSKHIQYDLCAELESEAKCLAICEDVDLTLSGHVLPDYSSLTVLLFPLLGSTACKAAECAIECVDIMISDGLGNMFR